MKTPLFLMLFSLHSIAATIIPFERDFSRIDEFAYLQSSNGTSEHYMDNYAGDEEDNLYFQGFGIQNMGPNVVVTPVPEDYEYAFREFSFVTSDRARRDNYLWVTDYNGSGSMSDFYETMLVFLPRENQMHVEEHGDHLLVTLNTGEEVYFTKEHKMLSGGVLYEAPLDLNPDRGERKFAQISYTGKGLVIRSDARAADPRLAKKVQILRKSRKPCELEGKLFWTQVGFPKFRYVTDEEAYAVIEKGCGKDFLQ